MIVGVLVLAAVVAVHSAVVLVVSRRVREAQVTLDEVFVDQRALPTADQLNRWGEQLHASLRRGEQEVRSASVQLRQTTETLAWRVQQVEREIGLDPSMPRTRSWTDPAGGGIGGVR